MHVHSNLNITNKSARPFLFTTMNNSLYQIIKCNMLSKSSKWELSFVYYIAKFTKSRFVISSFECTLLCKLHVFVKLIIQNIHCDICSICLLIRGPPKIKRPPYYHKIVYKIANKFLEVMNITAFFPENFCKSSYFFILFPLI